ncbi:hypothetical protein MLD38_006817 [Melastoma candidum]|uniref:Uncharacterized protein n=1 Tax=Melastoma candidum TaxID=119954 RepID=A0ACB9RP36_9MYRT|nr:hypothetical protein MLD38_006817 [Melastoma candidum]
MWAFPFRLRPTYASKFLPKPGYSCVVLSTHALRINLDTREEETLLNFEVPVRSFTKLDGVKSEHALCVVSGNSNKNAIITRLVNRYAFLGDISSARITFNQIQKKDAYLWNSMLAAYVRRGSYNEALECYRQFLLSSDVQPDFYTFPPLLKACRSLSDGKRLHCMVLKLGYEVDVFVSASLVHLYSRNGLLDIARDIFDCMPLRDMGSWNAMLSGYCQNENAYEALDILYSIKSEGLKMDSVTICSVLPMVAQLNDVLSGLMIHVHIIKHGLEFDLFVNNALINMYAKLGHLADGQYIFDCMVTKDVVSWNSMIAACEQNNDPITACWLFRRMLSVGEKPDLLTMVSLASAVAQVNDSQSALVLHCYCTRRNWLSDGIVIGNAVMDMYAKLGNLNDAKKVFDCLPAKDVISWNTLITGYTQNGLASEALEAYWLMEKCEYVSPNHGTWVNVLPACAALGALKEGMRFHGLVTKNGLFADVFVGTCVVDMYGKCGRLDYAMSLFYKISRISTVPWNAMISCHGIHGHANQCVELFEEMLDAGVQPDYITFVSLLSACSHAGLLDKGKLYFQMMKEKCGLKPGLKHYGCMVDLLGRAGHLEEAYQFIKDMPIHPDASIWGAVLGACRVHGNAELGAFASERLFEVDSDNVGYYVLLSNIYASAGKWELIGDVPTVDYSEMKHQPGYIINQGFKNTCNCGIFLKRE